MAEQTVYVEGIAQLDRTFRKLDRELQREVRDELRVVAEPVRSDAETLARSRITNMTLPWSRMRTGVTPKLVYVVPKKRGTKVPPRRRPNFAPLMRKRAMEPALEQNRTRVIERLNNLLVYLAKREGL